MSAYAQERSRRLAEAAAIGLKQIARLNDDYLLAKEDIWRALRRHPVSYDDCSRLRSAERAARIALLKLHTACKRTLDSHAEMARAAGAA